MILNNPNCPDCADYGYSAGTGAPTGAVPMGPGETIKDAGRVSLVAGVAKAIAFTQISVINSTRWAFAGVPTCYNSSNESIGYEITNKTGTGFTVTAMEDSTFEYMCVKI
jgi:hypothetical protein